MELVAHFCGEGEGRRVYKDEHGYFYLTNPPDNEEVMIADFGSVPPYVESKSEYANSIEELLLKCTPGFYWFRLDGSVVDLSKWHKIHRERLANRDGTEDWK